MGTIYVEFEEEALIRQLAKQMDKAPKDVIGYLFRYIDFAKFEQWMVEHIAAQSENTV